MSDEWKTPCASWSDDCQGKQDFDGRLLSISTRYWPGPGSGGTMAVDAGTGVIGSAPYGPRPSAKSSILLNFGVPDEYGYADYTPWREAEFEAETEAECKELVEAWVRERFEEVKTLLGIMGPRS